MNFNNQGVASFFKILLMESTDRLPLPPAFVKKHLQKRSTKKQIVVLKIISGVKWRVTYSKIKDTYYFMDGWLKFMKDNGVQMGSFLVFWLLSARSPNPVFQVFIYGPNGCLQPPITAGESNGKIALVKEEAIDDGSLVNVQQTMTRVMIKKYNYHAMAMKASFLKSTGIFGCHSVQLRNDEGKTWDVKLKTYASGWVTRMTKGWYDFKKYNKIKIGSTCEFYHVKSNLLHVRVMNADEGDLLKLESI